VVVGQESGTPDGTEVVMAVFDFRNFLVLFGGRDT